MNGATIDILYFARVAELTGTRSESWPLADGNPITGTQLLDQLQQRYPGLAPTERLKLAVNQYHVRHEQAIKAGDEVALFDPVTGG